MTNEQAKEIVKRIKGYMGDGECWSESEFMAMDMAIKSLSQEPCTDAVSREAVKEILTKYRLGESRIAEELNELPSVNPQPICEEREKGECPWYAG